MTHRSTAFVVLAACLCGLIVGCHHPAACETDEGAKTLSASQGPLPPSDAQAAPKANIAAELKKASQLADADKLDDALSQVDRVLKTRRDHVPALLARGRILMRMNRSGDAGRSLQRVVQLEPGNLDAKLMLGYCYLDQRILEAAERSLVEVAYSEGTVRQRISAYLGLASVYEHLGQKELVSVCYREAIDLDESVEEILMQAERQFFWPNPVSGGEGRLSRPSPSMREIEKVIGEAKKTPQ
jgi:predicted Zn-dependent protease